VKPHIFRPAAAADIEAIHRRYQEERGGLGTEFLVEAGRTVATVVNLPEAYPVLHRDTRRALIRRFPYGLLYRTIGDLVVFVGCFHTSPRSGLVEGEKMTEQARFRAKAVIVGADRQRRRGDMVGRGAHGAVGRVAPRVPRTVDERPRETY
jgi:hypothetical protein